MESAQKAENRKAAKYSERKSTENDSEEELQPPSPIHIAPEAALVPDFDFPDPQELRRIESDTQSRLKAILEVAGVTGLSQIDAQTFQDPEILRKLTNSVSTALDEAATALTRMKSEKQGGYEAFLRGANQAPSPTPLSVGSPQQGTKTGSITASSSSSSSGTTKQSETHFPPHLHPHQLHHHHGNGQHQQPLGVSPGESMQTVQRLLTQGR